MHKGHDNNVN